MLAPDLVSLLNTVVRSEERWRFLRRVLQDAGERQTPKRLTGAEPSWASALSDVPVPELLAQLRAHAPQELAAIDALAVGLLPASERLGRVAPVAPAHLCLVGRAEMLDSLLAHPAYRSGGHLHLYGPRGAGRSLVASQLARQAADRVPVVVWLDGRTRDGLAAGLHQLARDLGFPVGAAQQRSRQLEAWFGGRGEWYVVIDDAPEVLPTCLQSKKGQLVTIGTAPRPEAHVNVVLPPLAAAARSEAVRRWSRGRAQPQSSELSLAVTVRIAAASARSPSPVSTLAAAIAALSKEAQSMASLLRCFSAAPLPFSLLRWPNSVPAPAPLDEAFQSLLQSERICRAAVSELVRAGWAHWSDDLLVFGEWPAGDAELAVPHHLAALLVVHALHASEELPLSWIPHVRKLSNDPTVPSHIRRAIAARAGRLALSTSDPHFAVEWFQGALAALDDSTEARAASSGLLNDLGVAWRRSGRLDEAAAVFRDALALDEASADADPLPAASTRTNLAHILREQGNMNAAHDLYRAAHAARRRLLGDAHVQTGAVAIQLGVTAQALGDHSGARAAWTDAIQGLCRCRPMPRLLLAKVLQMMARLSMREGLPAEALPLAQRAYTLLMSEHDDMDHPSVSVVRDLVSGIDRQLDARSADS
ncbi:MAG: hypothetical protein CL927_18160 [Deltaproteobacteria bacterium]|nr:hypothetical protein [Deltaproteobacteria bacterium]